MEIIGIDIGFGFTKATNGRDFRVFKSVFGEAQELQFREQIVPEAPGDEYIHLEHDGKTWFVGELAERHSIERLFTLDQKQFVDQFTRTLALAALARMVERQDPVKLVAGLPISHYRRYKDAVVKQLEGQHKVTLIERDGSSKATVVRIVDVRVVPQPFGTMLNLLFTDMGEVGQRRFLTEKIGIIDVGFRTTDYTIADKTRYSERGSSTSDSGISRAFAAIAARLQENTGVNVELYRLFEAVTRGSIKIRGQQYDLKTLTDQAMSQLASSVATDANRLWSDDWDIDAIVITGGGGRVLAPYLEPLVQGKIVPIEAGIDTRLNNVKGYLKYGKHLWARATAA